MTPTDAEKLSLPEAPEAPVPAPAAPVQAAPVQAAPVQAAPARRTRRVGTLTMGAALILTGACLCIGLLRPETDFLFLLKLSPLLLVALGCEIVLASFLRDVRLKYDFLSMIVCFLLIVASLAAACVPAFLRYASPARHSAEAYVENTLEESTYAALRGNRSIDSLRYSVSIAVDGTRDYTQPLTPAELAAGDHVVVHVTLHGDWADEAAFAAACRPVLEAVRADCPQVRSVYFETREDGGAQYALSLSGPYQFNFSDAELAACVNRYDAAQDAGYYMTEEEAEEIQQETEDLLQRLDEAETRAEEAETRAEEAENRAEEAEARAA